MSDEQRKTKTLLDILHPERDRTPITPHPVLKDFLEGTIYKDFAEEVRLMIESLRDYYEDCDSKQYLETRGALKGIRMVAMIFEYLHENALDDQTREINEEEN